MRKLYLDPPKPPPFPVGTRLRCLGNLDRQGSAVYMGKERTLVWGKGLEVEIVDTRPGHQGTGRLIDYDDEGEPWYDETEDGSSVYRINGHGRLIRRDMRHQWEVIK